MKKNFPFTEQTSDKLLSNPLLHYSVITLIILVGMLSFVVCIMMMTTQGMSMMNM